MQNGKPPDENGVNGETPAMRHRGHGEEADGSAQGPTESTKSYTAEQLEAVRKSVNMWICSFVLVITLLHSIANEIGNRFYIHIYQ